MVWLLIVFSVRGFCATVNNTASNFFATMSGYYYHVHNNPNWHFYGDPHHHTTSKVLNLVPILLRLRQLESLDLQSQQKTPNRIPCSCEDEMVMYNATIKVFNSTNKKDFTVCTLKGLSAKDFLTLDTLREEVFHHLGKERSF